MIIGNHKISNKFCLFCLAVFSTYGHAEVSLTPLEYNLAYTAKKVPNTPKGESVYSSNNSELMFTYGGVPGLYVSSNNGKSWTKSSSSLANESIDYMWGHGSTTYAATICKLFKSSNNGSSWSEVEIQNAVTEDTCTPRIWPPLEYTTIYNIWHLGNQALLKSRYRGLMYLDKIDGVVKKSPLFPERIIRNIIYVNDLNRAIIVTQNEGAIYTLDNVDQVDWSTVDESSLVLARTPIGGGSVYEGAVVLKDKIIVTEYDYDGNSMNMVSYDHGSTWEEYSEAGPEITGSIKRVLISPNKNQVIISDGGSIRLCTKSILPETCTKIAFPEETNPKVMRDSLYFDKNGVLSATIIHSYHFEDDPNPVIYSIDPFTRYYSLGEETENFSLTTFNGVSVFYFTPPQEVLVETGAPNGFPHTWSGLDTLGTPIKLKVKNENGDEFIANIRAYKKFFSPGNWDRQLLMNDGVQNGYGPLVVTINRDENSHLPSGSYSAVLLAWAQGWPQYGPPIKQLYIDVNFDM